MTVKEEVDEMLKSLTEVVSGEVKPVPEPKVEEKIDEPVSEPKTEEPKVKEEVKVEPESDPEPEPKSEDKKEEPKVEIPDERDKIIEDLRAKLAEKSTVKLEPEKKPIEKPIEIADQDFVGEVDLDELGRDPAEFNKVLNKIYKQAVIDTRKGLLQDLPEVIKTNISVMNTLKETSERFYENNSDLKPFKKVVATVFEELAAQMPDATYDKVIEAVAPEVRKRLDLGKKVETKSDKGSDPPKLPQKGAKAGRSQDKPTIEPLQAELEEMNKTLGR